MASSGCDSPRVVDYMMRSNFAWRHSHKTSRHRMHWIHVWVLCYDAEEVAEVENQLFPIFPNSPDIAIAMAAGDMV